MTRPNSSNSLSPCKTGRGESIGDWNDTRTSARCGDRRRAHPVLPLQYALRGPLEPRHDDGGAQRPRRSLRSQGSAHRRGRRRRSRHAFQGFQPDARSGPVVEARAVDAGRHADPGVRHLAASGADVGGEDRDGRDRMRDLRRLRHDVGRSDRVLEEVFQTAGRGWPAEDGSRQAQGVQRFLARRTCAATAGRVGAAHGPFDGPALRADGAGLEDCAPRPGQARLREPQEGGGCL